MFAYSVRNDEIAQYEPPFFCHSEAEARKWFKAMFIAVRNNPSPAVQALLDKMTVYKVGTWSPADGSLVSYEMKPLFSVSELFSGDDDEDIQ